VFAGLSEVLAFLNTYRFTEEHIAFLRLQLVHAEDEFFEYLGSLNCSQVKVFAFQEGRFRLILLLPLHPFQGIPVDLMRYFAAALSFPESP
jgi:nicotinate phosphoribosyltransferase